MNNDEIFNINVTLSDWRLPLTIPREDEEIYRCAEKIFNSELADMLTGGKIQLVEALKMLAYNGIVNFVRESEKHNDLMEKLQSWGNEVDNTLENN
ncbi:MAG: hypothetical protein LBS01_06575 [Prevotellaceae bacterium]|jgi:hypothetical protein|nr:hypothetical protein [Prevotellaceae bacterium]